jgi:hypothetical protein
MVQLMYFTHIIHKKIFYMIVSKWVLCGSNHPFQVLHSMVGSRLYLQTLDKAVKAWQEKTLLLIGSIHKLRRKSSVPNMAAAY